MREIGRIAFRIGNFGCSNNCSACHKVLVAKDFTCLMTSREHDHSCHFVSKSMNFSAMFSIIMV